MNETLIPSDKVFSVTELNNLIKELLEGFPTINLEGEISNYRPNSSGHLYFNLKDQNSVISAVMFRGAASYLTFAPKDGTKVQVTGKLSVYGPQGKYQIIISKMSICGEGAILKMIEDRKRKLAQEGLFDQAVKKKIPIFPKTIGVVTSPTGAALRDILQITKRRNKCVSVIVLPALVQGNEAAETIVRQIRNANRAKLCDVLIVGRGGGSLEDLLPFSEESVVRAIYESEIPVVSAVGHEIDWALSDYAADLRAPTPSAAAEITVPELAKIKAALTQYSQSIYQETMNRLQKIRLTVKSFDPQNLELKFRSIEVPLLTRFDNAKEAIFQNITTKIRDTRQIIDNCVTVLENASPQTIFDRGYSMVKIKESGKILRDSSEVKTGEEIEIIPAKGKIKAQVLETN
ncbi:MAG: exodeoxyribonuclease VII large subunit [Treponema sp.]|nr:exodeoxyribonuclease VII large subunit [Treponema sp.]